MPTKQPAAGPKGVTPARLEVLRNESVRTLRELELSLNRTQKQLRFMETLMRRSRRQIESGRPISTIAPASNVGEARAATSAIIREVQSKRHQAQRAAFRQAAAEGCSLAEIARLWGVSRQLVSRMAKEPAPRRKKT